MKHACDTCGAKPRCLKRSLLIFQLYIVTGRSRELTPEVHEDICIEDDCEHWIPFAPTAKEETPC